MSDIAIETSEISRDFGRYHAVDGVTLSVERGQILALAGPNGAGGVKQSQSEVRKA